MTRHGSGFVEVSAGYYATRDPWQPHIMTFWQVDVHGEARDFPPRSRWRPLRPTGSDAESWYAGPYYDWRRQVAIAIEDDPYGARHDFARVYPDPERVAAAPRPRPARSRQPTYSVPRRAQELLDRDARTDADALLAAALHRAGHSYVSIGAALGISKSTAHRRVEHGRGLIAVTAPGATTMDMLAAALSRFGDDTVTEAVVAIVHRRQGQGVPPA